MQEILVIETGLFNESEQLDMAIKITDSETFYRTKLDHQNMTSEDWDVLLERVMFAKTVITV